ncbi:5-formyltetrahydrofolate cyclo-ligase [Blastococcus xanthinilyticus]|uniref:5-formyltetrahydrofolate cyclo-ligase n=1 Tax=Blastococcus xanthinilyticus TaxID=1564164 RepID=A0A5S5CZM8_9ACTN|nr:5-formyltetrahydrofolate cyclo-ligase [Blastococcus xanthinilyticus]TYP89217.1 5-formyltetrahydrofolate cyclo-ligase [Blastococcus xanthinilyticus]
MVEPDPVLAKVELRARLLARRRARPAGERVAAADAVATALLEGLAGVGTLAAFVPDADEPGTGRLPGGYAALGARVLLPVVPDRGRVMDWGLFTGGLEPGRYGLSHPTGPRLGPEAIGQADAVVVPALAVDRAGIRLGRGGGYYDRALVHARPDAVLVTLVFDDERVDELPAEVHDRPVTAVVTPSGGWQALPPPGR